METSSALPLCPCFCHRRFPTTPTRKKEVPSYGILILSHQRHQPRQRVRHHRPRLYDGLRHCQDAELRPRRRHHDRRLRFLLRDVLSGSSQHRRGADGRCRVHRPRHRHRAPCLQAPALRAEPRGAHHRHRRELFPPELRAAHLEGRRALLSPRGHGRCEDLRRQADRFLHLPSHDLRLRRHHDRADAFCQQEQDGQGHACLRRHS